MDQNAVALLTIFTLLFISLLWGKIRYDVSAFLALILAISLNIISVEEAFLGFSHHATIIVALVLIISKCFTNVGFTLYISKKIITTCKTIYSHILSFGILGSLMSSFMNNVATLAILMPVDLKISKKSKWLQKQTLMPLSFATILGVMVTMIGTPPNIIISSFREEYFNTGFKMFDFFYVGIFVCIIGLIYLILIGWKLIPLPTTKKNPNDDLLEDIEYFSELQIPSGSPLHNSTIIQKFPEKLDVMLVAVQRDKQKFTRNLHNKVLKEGDILYLNATTESLEEFRVLNKLNIVKNDADEKFETYDDFTLTELVVLDDSRVSNKSIQTVGLEWRLDTNLLGISRQGKKITKSLKKVVLKAGDLLLLLVPKNSENEVSSWLGCIPLIDRELSLYKTNFILPAILIFIFFITLATLGFLKIIIALSIVTMIFVLLKIIEPKEIYDSVEWSIIVLIGCMIPLGNALVQTGLTDVFVDNFFEVTSHFSPWVILTMLMIITMCLSDILNNTATAIIFSPIAIKLAERLEVSADPFLMAVAISASCAFLTPIGHKNNTLIMGPGGYKFSDYWKIGLPLEMIIICVSIPLLMIFWPI